MKDHRNEQPTYALPPRNNRGRREWMRAIRGIRLLLADTERTDQVFEIIHALTGNSLEPTYQAFAADPYGAELLTRRTRLLDRLSDHTRLSTMPQGSLGRAYFRFMKKRGFAADGLIEAQGAARIHDETHHPPIDAEREYIAERIRDMHDLWHVLTDYGTDDAGELTNLWFSVGQLANPGMAFIAFIGTLRAPQSMAWWRYNLRAYLRGRRARRLVCAPFENMLERPLDEVRRELNIAPTQQVHPDGIYYGKAMEQPTVLELRLRSTKAGVSVGSVG